MKDHDKFIGNCELCNRVKSRSFHHLIPRTCHRNKWFKKRYTKMEMATRGLMLCSRCHRYVHECHSEKELGKNYNTKELLMADEKIFKFIKWVVKKK